MTNRSEWTQDLYAVGLSSTLVAGALQGAIVWAIYGIVEMALLAVAPFLVEPSSALFTRWHWFMSAVSLLVYAGIGAAFGLAAGVLLRFAARARTFRGAADRAHLLQTLVTIPLLAAFLLQLSVRTTASSFTRFCLAVGALLLVPVVMNAIPRLRSQSVAVLASPWSVALLLLGLPWLWEVAEQDRPLSADLACVLLYLALLAAAWRVDARLRASTAPARRPMRYALSACAGAALFAITGAALNATINPAPEPGESLSPKPPDVVLLVLDTVRGDHTSLNGYRRDTTPGLRKLAEQSTVYLNAIATSNFTLPTHASLFTGLYPRRHGATRESPEASAPNRLSHDLVTLAEVLSERGFATAAASANSAFINDYFGMDQGFDTFRVHDLLPPPYYLQRGVLLLLRPTGIGELTRRYQSAGQINADVFPILDRLAGSDAPFFLFVNYMDAHVPLLPPPYYRDLYPRRMRNFAWPQFEELSVRLQTTRTPFTDEEAEAVVALYDGAIAYLDSQIAQLVERLRRLGRFDNTLLIVTSDHGEGLGNHLLMGHGASTYQHQVGVPLLIKYPGQRTPARITELASQVDVMPTVLDVLGCRAPAPLDGLSLRRGVPAGRSVFAVSVPARRDLARPVGPDSLPQHAAVVGTTKLIAGVGASPRLYNFADDPREVTDIAAADPAATRSMLTLLDNWLAATPSYSGSRKTTDPKNLERLRELGYIQ
ncbi:MAG: sulfatase [Bryobacteraceae bacterium]|nr:sulfatase [Bryobacteraceae bacterium]